MKHRLVIYALTALLLPGCKEKDRSPAGEGLDYCLSQLEKSMREPRPEGTMPRNILSGETGWNHTSVHDWTSGFWPGVLWYAYEYSQDDKILEAALQATADMFAVVDKKSGDHDIGFMIYCSLGNGWRLTGNELYREKLLEAARILSALYRPVPGTINSWAGFNKRMGWQHNTIIDNMLNLELLYWASRNGGGEHLAGIASRHAEVTMNNHFRDDHSTYHVIGYDTIAGDRTAAITHQGYADNSMWARGQAWAIYGFTMCHRETGRKDFLKTACDAADLYLSRLPDDLVPYWDFDAPGIPDEPRDASAAAIVASALLELSQYVSGDKACLYRQKAERMLNSLSSAEYQSRDSNTAFLKHVTGHYPGGSEIDVSIIYADYYYIEALLRLRKLVAGEKLFPEA